MAYPKRKSRSYNAGYERAKQHIEDAKRLTYELGGTDTDVKKWFFSLNSSQRETIFKKYGQKYGEPKEEYARIAYPEWKSGKTKMSGLVAERLFNLLPPLMPVKDKYALVESLWNHVGPKKKVLIKAGVKASTMLVIDQVKKEVSKLTTEWAVPDQMTKRFKWLAQNDSAVYQQLLSYIKQREKELGEAVLTDQIPELKAKFSNDISETTSRISYIIDVGKQMVELRMEGSGENIDVVDWYPAGRKGSGVFSDGGNWWIWLIIGAIVLYFFTAK